VLCLVLILIVLCSVDTVAWLRQYATSLKVMGSNPGRIIGFFQFTFSFQLHYGPGVYSSSNRNDYKKSSGGGGIWHIKLTTSAASASQCVLENVGSSVSHNPIGLHALLHR
jgi:hypothetical protein